jgi:very-short-patch-repair endonuclease
MSADELRLARIARYQHGVFSRAQALECGFAPRTIARRLSAGRWRVVAHGIYASAALRLGPRAQWWAGLLRFGAQAVLSHHTAARIWHLPVRGTAVHITVAPTARCRARDGVTLHRLRLDPADVRTVDGFPVTSFTRTVLDCCVQLDDGAAAELLEHVLQRQRVTIEGLYDAIRARVGWHGTPRLLHLVAALDPAAHSRAERRLHAGLSRRGVQGWVKQHRVVDGDGHVRDLDVAFVRVRLGIEIDGWAWHSGRDRFQRDRWAHNRLDRLGWHVLHFTWADVMLRLDAVLDEIESRLRQLSVA